jgi:hypothetical protein
MVVLTAICLAALCGFLGLGLDVAVWNSNYRSVQRLSDTTAIGVARLLGSSSQTATSITAAATNIALLNGFSSATDTISVSFGPSGAQPPSATTVTVTVTRQLTRIFSALFLTSNPTTSASATASYNAGGGVCFYIVDPSSSQTLLVNSGFSLNAPKCQINVASTSSSAAIFNSGSTLNVKKTCIAGGDINNGGTVGGLTTGCTPSAYSGTLPSVTVGSCTVNSANYSGTVSLSPGVYCGNFNFNGSGTLNLAAGLYIFKGTTWNINSGWTIAGTGVTLYFANSSSYVQFNSGTTVNLTAPTSGTYANILIFEPSGLSTSSIAIDGTSASGHALQGLVYLPSRNITFNSTYSGVADAFTLVAHQVIFDSNSSNTWSVSPASGSSSSSAVTMTN